MHADIAGLNLVCMHAISFNIQHGCMQLLLSWTVPPEPAMQPYAHFRLQSQVCSICHCCGRILQVV